MTQQYPILTYKGNLEGHEEAQPGTLLGWDETFRPYEVLDATYTHGRPLPPSQAADWDEHGCAILGGDCRRAYPHTHVFLQYAAVETIQAQAAAYADKMRLRGAL
jgi:hypothetical protein